MDTGRFVTQVAAVDRMNRNQAIALFLSLTGALAAGFATAIATAIMLAIVEMYPIAASALYRSSDLIR
jgi:hypothetical protein